jgi:hypothetical protein
MKYLLLIYENEASWHAREQAEKAEIYREYRAFTEEIVRSGHYCAGEELQPTSTATTVRVRDGRPLLTDGPFAETREQLGGFYFVEARDLDDALALAARIPSARTGSIEVRPVNEMKPPAA